MPTKRSVSGSGRKSRLAGCDPYEDTQLTHVARGSGVREFMRRVASRRVAHEPGELESLNKAFDDVARDAPGLAAVFRAETTGAGPIFSRAPFEEENEDDREVDAAWSEADYLFGRMTETQRESAVPPAFARHILERQMPIYYTDASGRIIGERADAELNRQMRGWQAATPQLTLFRIGVNDDFALDRVTEGFKELVQRVRTMKNVAASEKRPSERKMRRRRRDDIAAKIRWYYQHKAGASIKELVRASTSFLDPMIRRNKAQQIRYGIDWFERQFQRESQGLARTQIPRQRKAKRRQKNSS